ncbi:amidohydrolase family protein [Microbacterium sp. 18062]|uniref:amidohydrolase family protein n=1 Tax=Microbacterium sp. 18062 TaxID=2681410 RepID=UPI00135889B4|nr:amidohydrolase family protein [Microbacterium sp. 18062]
MSSLVLHRARTVLPVAPPPIADGAVLVDGGTVVRVGTHDELTAALRDAAFERVEWDGTLVPGLVNAHTHLQYSDMAVVGQGSYSGFETWMSAFMELYPVPRDWGASAAEGARQALRTGTTAVAEIVTDPEAAAATHEAGLHGVAYWEVLGWSDAAWGIDGRETVIAQLRALPEPPTAGISPHAIYSLDTEVLRDLTALAAELGVRQHIHAAESAWEDAYVRTGTGDLADRARAHGRGEFALLRDGGAGHGVIAYLDSVGALNPRTHLAHGVYVDADDRALLRRRGVSVALCPRSNAVIGLDPPPIGAYLREGNPIAVGTDSLSSSPSLNVLDDVAALYSLARSQGYADADLHARLLGAATRGGAVALGLDAPATGVLQSGARADLAVFPIRAGDPRDALAELVEVGAPESLATIIDGRTRSRAAAGPWRDLASPGRATAGPKHDPADPREDTRA